MLIHLLHAPLTPASLSPSADARCSPIALYEGHLQSHRSLCNGQCGSRKAVLTNFLPEIGQEISRLPQLLDAAGGERSRYREDGNPAGLSSGNAIPERGRRIHRVRKARRLLLRQGRSSSAAQSRTRMKILRLEGATGGHIDVLGLSRRAVFAINQPGVIWRP